MKTIIKNAKETLTLGALTSLLNVSAVFAATCEEGILGGAQCVTGDTDLANRKLLGEGGVIENVIQAFLLIIGVISVIMLIVGGLRYIVSGGDQQAVTDAKNTILYAIVGIIITFLAFGIVEFVTSTITG